MARFNFSPTPLEGLFAVQRTIISDGRGSLARLYGAEEFREAGLNISINQINHSFTQKRCAVRGLHFQYPPHAEVKIVTCIRGEVFDVAVDLRRGSATFLCWHGVVLSAAQGNSLLIPRGFAHGFQSMSDDCDLIYLHSESYQPEAEGALNISDPRIGIVWPLPLGEISEKDRTHRWIDHEFQGISL